MRWFRQWLRARQEATEDQRKKDEDQIWLRFANHRSFSWLSLAYVLFGIVGVVVLVISIVINNQNLDDQNLLIAGIVLSFVFMVWGLTMGAVVGIGRALLHKIETLEFQLHSREASTSPSDENTDRKNV